MNRKLTWATTWQNQLCGCVPSQDSHQPGHQPSLIRVFAVCMKKAWVLSYPMSAQRRLWSDWADAQADLSLCCAHIHFVGFVMRWLTFLSFYILEQFRALSDTFMDIFYYFFFYGPLRLLIPFELCPLLKGAKARVLQEKPPNHPQAELGLPHVTRARLEIYSKHTM